MLHDNYDSDLSGSSQRKSQMNGSGDQPSEKIGARSASAPSTAQSTNSSTGTSRDLNRYFEYKRRTEIKENFDDSEELPKLKEELIRTCVLGQFDPIFNGLKSKITDIVIGEPGFNLMFDYHAYKSSTRASLRTRVSPLSLDYLPPAKVDGHLLAPSALSLAGTTLFFQDIQAQQPDFSAASEPVLFPANSTSGNSSVKKPGKKYTGPEMPFIVHPSVKFHICGTDTYMYDKDEEERILTVSKSQQLKASGKGRMDVLFQAIDDPKKTIHVCLKDVWYVPRCLNYLDSSKQITKGSGPFVTEDNKLEFTVDGQTTTIGQLAVIGANQASFIQSLVLPVTVPDQYLLPPEQLDIGA